MKGMIVEVFRSEIAATNGITGTADNVILVGDGIPPVFDVNDRKVLFLTQRPGGSWCAQPSLNDKKWYMFGGNFIWTSDSRFRKISEAPIPVHDRCENDAFGPNHMAVKFVSGELLLVEFDVSLSRDWMLGWLSDSRGVIQSNRMISAHDFKTMERNYVPSMVVDTATVLGWFFTQIEVGNELQCYAASDGIRGPAMVSSITTLNGKVNSVLDEVGVTGSNGKKLIVRVQQLAPRCLMTGS